MTDRGRHTACEETDTHDAEANDLLIEISGRFLSSSSWAIRARLGESRENGALLAVIGHQQFTLGLDTNVVTSYSLDGKATDLCSLLSGGAVMRAMASDGCSLPGLCGLPLSARSGSAQRLVLLSMQSGTIGAGRGVEAAVSLFEAGARRLAAPR